METLAQLFYQPDLALALSLCIVAGLAGGFLYRARGGGIITGSTQFSRLAFWVIPCTLLAVVGLVPIGFIDAAILLAFFALTWLFAAAGHAIGMVFEVGHLGHRQPGHWNPEDGKWHDTLSKWPLRLVFGDYDPYWPINRKYAYMAFAGGITGLARGLPWLLVKFWLMPVISAVAWLLAYWAGWQWIGYRRICSRLAGETELAEFLYGAAIFTAAMVYIVV